MKFGERLKQYRNNVGLKQEDVANMIGISTRAYASYETKNVRPRKMETYRKLANVFKCPINDLLVEDFAEGFHQGYIGLTLMTMGIPFLGPFGGLVAATIAPLAFWLNKTDGTITDLINYQKRLTTKYEKELELFKATSLGIILTELGKKNIKYRVGVNQELFPTPKGNFPDKYIIIDNQTINEWWFVMWTAANKENELTPLSELDRRNLLFSRFPLEVPNPKRKASYVLDDKDLFDSFCELKQETSYRGNLSVILIDIESTIIIKEELLSSFDPNDFNDILPII